MPAPARAAPVPEPRPLVLLSAFHNRQQPPRPILPAPLLPVLRPLCAAVLSEPGGGRAYMCMSSLDVWKKISATLETSNEMHGAECTGSFSLFHCFVLGFAVHLSMRAVSPAEPRRAGQSQPLHIERVTHTPHAYCNRGNA
eukprot:3438290-Rhodomonas_salina.2